MSTPAGNILKELLESNIKLGVSSRGMGSLQENADGLLEVQDDFDLNKPQLNVQINQKKAAFMSPKGRALQEGVEMPTYQYNNVNNIIRDIICDNTGVCKC